MAFKNPTNQPMEHVEVPDAEDDGQEHDNAVHTPLSPPQEKLKVSEDHEESQEEESKEESHEEEIQGDSGEDEKQASTGRSPTQTKGGEATETNPTIMTNSAASKEERDDLDKGKMETELRIQYLGIFLEYTELHKRMAVLKRKARHHNIKIEDEEDDGCLLPSKKRCDWCNMLKHLP